MKFPNVPSTSVKLMLFPFSLEGAARIWLDKEPPRSILHAWTVSNDLLRALPAYGFSELHQLDTFYNALNSNDQDSLNSAAGGNFLDKMPRECLKIIESKSKVRNSRSKPVVAKVSTSTSTSGISPDVSELKDMVKALLLDKKNQSQAPAHQTPTSVKAIKRIVAYVSQAAAANFNQGSTSARPPMVANQIRPPVKDQFITPVNQPPNLSTPVYQAPAPQTQGVSKTDFDSYVKANDAVMRNVQNQGQNLQAQLNNLATSNQRLESMLSNFIKMNTASTSGSGTLPGNTITNPKEDLKGITTRSGVAYQGPAIPSTSSSPPKVMNRDTEVTKDMIHPTITEAPKTSNLRLFKSNLKILLPSPMLIPLVLQCLTQTEHHSIPSRRNNERRREKANDHIGEILRNLDILVAKFSFINGCLDPLCRNLATSTLKT
ncbi:hypothetical protein Tco_1578536 [Tanacetum coccineum]